MIPKKLDASGKKKWRMVIDFRKLNVRGFKLGRIVNDVILWMSRGLSGKGLIIRIWICG